MTSLLLLLFAPESSAQEPVEEEAPVEEAARPRGEAQEQLETEEPKAENVARAAGEEARGTARSLSLALYNNLPRLLVALGVLVAGWLVTRLVRSGLRAVLGRWQRTNATTALVEIGIWVLVAGLAISVVVGDIRAAIGSVGLVGLALSWALQTPIESFTGWLLNSFRGYYHVGDRVSVGEVFGDVYRIDFLTTTVWEIGGPERGTFVNAEQPTGRLITFPNNEILAGSVVNLTRDFPYVWDELGIQLANESDLRYAMQVLQRVADEVLGASMAEPALAYEKILKDARLSLAVSPKPEVFLFLADSWTTVIVRYLVDARQRRKWKTELILRISEELRRPEHQQKIISALPRQQIQFLDEEGRPAVDRR